MAQHDPRLDTIVAALAADGIFERAHPVLSREAVIEIARLLDERLDDLDTYDVCFYTDEAVLLAVDQIRQGKQGNDQVAFLDRVVERVCDPSVDGRVRMAWWSASLDDSDPTFPKRPWERLEYHWDVHYIYVNPNTRAYELAVALAIARSALNGEIPPEARASAFPPLSPAERISWEQRLADAQAALSALALERGDRGSLTD